jgi:hypothetical protein
MSNYESDLSVEKIFSPRELSGPCVVSDKDTETLEWIHGDSDVRFKVDIQMCCSDVGYLLEHIFLNLMNLMLDRDTLGGAWPDSDGEEQLQNWRLINLLCIKSGGWTRDDVKEKFLEICEVHDVENDPVILGLFDRYVV